MLLPPVRELDGYRVRTHIAMHDDVVVADDTGAVFVAAGIAVDAISDSYFRATRKADTSGRIRLQMKIRLAVDYRNAPAGSVMLDRH